MWQNSNERPEFAIGIDVGTHTGLAIWDRKKKQFADIRTCKIHRAMEIVLQYHRQGYKLIVRVEDARKATIARRQDVYKAQGAGSVKRDASIWEDFLADHGISFQLVRPNKRITKLSKQDFFNYTKYTGVTSTHSRDAGMLVYGM